MARESFNCKLNQVLMLTIRCPTDIFIPNELHDLKRVNNAPILNERSGVQVYVVESIVGYSYSLWNHTRT